MTKTMTYSHFIWGSEPRERGGWYPWEIINVLPECGDALAERVLAMAKEDNPRYLVVMTKEPKLPVSDETLKGQTSDLY